MWTEGKFRSQFLFTQEMLSLESNRDPLLLALHIIYNIFVLIHRQASIKVMPGWKQGKFMKRMEQHLV